MVKVNDIVMTEYGHVGKVIEINFPDEAVVDIFDFGIQNDTEYCSRKACRLATLDEQIKAFENETTNNK